MKRKHMRFLIMLGCVIVMLLPVRAFAAPDHVSTSSLWQELTRRVRVMGRFDVNFEWVNPTKRDGKKDFKNYHHFLMLKISPMENLTFFGEIIDQYFYEARWQIHPRVALKVGKIIVPFGGEEYHHWYGGLAGDPAKGLLLPMVWAELGGAFNFKLFDYKYFGLNADLYLIQGFGAKDFTKTIDLNAGASPDKVALGTRLSFRVMQNAHLYASFLWSQYLDGYNIFLYALDFVLDYNLIPVPFLRDLKVTFGGARADVQNPNGRYYKYGDYIQLEWGSFRQWVLVRVRYGTYIDRSNVVTNKDSHNFTVSVVITALKHIRVLLEHNFLLEEVNEIDNDFFRIQIAFEF